jgi:hypothetical protein
VIVQEKLDGEKYPSNVHVPRIASHKTATELYSTSYLYITYIYGGKLIDNYYIGCFVLGTSSVVLYIQVVTENEYQLKFGPSDNFWNCYNSVHRSRLQDPHLKVSVSVIFLFMNVFYVLY